MNSRIYSNKELIGMANLEVGDDSMGCLFGEFRPNEKYFQIAQNVIREFWKTQKPDYSKLKSLRLNVQLDMSGMLLLETRWSGRLVDRC